MDPKFLVELSGKQYPLFAGVLAEAHERGLASIETELVQVPAEENGHTAIVRAVVRMKDGGVFADLGDASPRNTNARITTALLRMASTRAKGRALRDACNIGQTLVEELPEEEAEAAGSGGNAKSAVGQVYRAGPQPVTAKYAQGFEREYADGQNIFQRQELIDAYMAERRKAMELGIALDQVEPHRMTNAALLEAGRALRRKLGTAKATAASGKVKPEKAEVA